MLHKIAAFYPNKTQFDIDTLFSFTQFLRFLMSNRVDENTVVLSKTSIHVQVFIVGANYLVSRAFKIYTKLKLASIPNSDQIG